MSGEAAQKQAEALPNLHEELMLQLDRCKEIVTVDYDTGTIAERASASRAHHLNASSGTSPPCRTSNGT